MCVYVCSKLVVVWVVFGVFVLRALFGVFEFYEVGGVVLYDKKLSFKIY